MSLEPHLHNTFYFVIRNQMYLVCVHLISLITSNFITIFWIIAFSIVTFFYLFLLCSQILCVVVSVLLLWSYVMVVESSVQTLKVINIIEPWV